MQLAAALEQLGHHCTVIAHGAGDGDLIALGGIVELDGHILHLKAAVGQLEARAQQLCKVSVHIQRGQQQLFGVGVGIVVVKAALRFLNAVDAAPHRCLAQGQVIDVLNAVKGHGVKQHQPFQLILIFLLLCRIIEQVGHSAHTGPQHGNKAHDHQNGDQKAQCLTPAAALHACMFFRGNRMFHVCCISQGCQMVQYSVYHIPAHCAKPCPWFFCESTRSAPNGRGLHHSQLFQTSG